MLFIDFDVIEDVVSSITDGGPLCELLLRIDDLIGAVTKQELRLDITLCTRDHALRAELLQK